MAKKEQGPVKRKRWSVPLAHPSFAIEPCPACDYPEADGGHCPECGWTRFEPTCPHRTKR